MKTSALTLLLLAMATVTLPAQNKGVKASDAASAVAGGRTIVSLNADWRYLEEDVATVSDLAGTEKSWARVNLPHTWNAWDAVDQVPGYRRAASWYKKELQLPAGKTGMRSILCFEGVNITSDVYVNGLRVGGHVGGYVGFDVDITSAVKEGSVNTVLVRASNAYDPDVIPSQKSDFHIYGGITRNVWLKVVPSVHLNNLTIKTPAVSAASADVEVVASIANDRKSADRFEIEAVVLDPNGKEIGREKAAQTVTTGTSSLTLRMPAIKKPKLWSPDEPFLYSIRVRLKESGTVVDELTDRFGCRWFEIKPHGPFFLNGKRLLLRGTHRHEDFAGYANAMPDSLQRQDMQMIKEMGANFVRLAHYPQAPIVYRLCDELGILVWDELPWCRGGMGGEAWKANTRRLLEEQIAQNFNHPSIIINSLGNELYWLPDVPDGDNLDSLRAMIKELNTISHRLAPGRLTATRKFTEAADLVDVVSPSIWPGWYSGNYKGFEKAVTEAKDKFAMLLHVEYGGDSHVGRHTEAPVTGDAMLVPDGFEENPKPQKIKSVALNSDWSESYIVDLFDWSLQVSERLAWLTGNAQWAFKDFPTPLRPENPIPYVNQKGLVDRAGKPKDAYYVFKSYWTTSPLFCYIESHTWTERSGPANLARELNVFSNCPEAEVFLNGVSQGKKKRDANSFPACGLSWQVKFQEGANSVKVVGWKGPVVAATDSISIRYSFRKNGVADHLELSSEQMPGGNLLITALAVDKDGTRCLDYQKRVYFTWDGPGMLMENYGTPTRSSVVEMANGKAQIEFSPAKAGRATIEVRNQDFKGEYLVVGGGSAAH